MAQLTGCIRELACLIAELSPARVDGISDLLGIEQSDQRLKAERETGKTSIGADSTFVVTGRHLAAHGARSVACQDRHALLLSTSDASKSSAAGRRPPQAGRQAQAGIQNLEPQQVNTGLALPPGLGRTTTRIIQTCQYEILL